MIFWRNSKRLFCVFALSIGAAMANVPEPDHTLFGTVSFDGQVLTTGLMTFVLDGDNKPIASYDLGSSPTLGTFFAIRIPMTLNQALTGGAAQAGRTGQLFINGKPVSRVTVGEAGDVQRLDFDTDLIVKTPGISIADAVGSESLAGLHGVEVKVRLNLAFANDQAVLVDWETVDGTAKAPLDYKSKSGRVTIPACTTKPLCPTTAEIKVTILDDNLTEGDPVNHIAGEYFHVRLFNPVNVVLLDDMATIMIIDDDDTPPAFTVNNLSILRPQINSVDAAFTVSINHTWHEDVSVDVSAINESANSGDFSLDNGEIIIPAGELSAQIPLEVFADNTAAEVETFRVHLQNASTGSITDAEGSGRIYRDARVLYFVESHFDNQQGINNMGGAVDVVHSPDGKHVYVASNTENALIVFSRNLQSGELTYITSYRDNQEGLKNLAGLQSLGFGANGRYLYVAGLEGVSVFSRDQGNGELTLLEVEENGLVDTQSGYQVEGLSGAIALAMGPRTAAGGGEHLYVAAYDDNAIAIFTRNPDNGLLTFKETVTDAGCDSGPGAKGLCGVSSVIVSSDGLQVYAAGRSDGTLAVFDRDPDSGVLSLMEVHTGVAGAMAVAVSGDGLSVYVAAQGDGTVVIFDRAGDGSLTYNNRVGGENNMLALSSDVVVSRDGLFVYATGYLEDTLVVFDRAVDGALSYREVERQGIAGVTGLNGVSALSVSPDDRHVYSASYLDGATNLFRRDVEIDKDWDVIFSSDFESAPAQGQQP